MEVVRTRSCVGQILRCSLFWYALLYVPETERYCWLQFPSIWGQSAFSTLQTRSRRCENSEDTSLLAKFRYPLLFWYPSRRLSGEKGTKSLQRRSMMSVFWSLFPRLRRSWISHIPWISMVNMLTHWATRVNHSFSNPANCGGAVCIVCHCILSWWRCNASQNTTNGT